MWGNDKRQYIFLLSFNFFKSLIKKAGVATIIRQNRFRDKEYF